MIRVLLFTGKGGVGKTTVAAATAVRAAAQGRRVLVTSTDPAHSLADVLDVPVGDRPTAVAPNLAAQQIDAQRRLEQHWHDVRDYLVQLLAWGGLGEAQAEELALVPGLDEVFSLIDLRAQIASRTYDLIVVDCAPTAETLRLLALPDALRWYVERIVGTGRHLARAVRPVVTRVSNVPVPADPVFGAVERINGDLAAVHAILRDNATTSVRLVVNPERMVINEAMRTATTLSLFGYAIDSVIVNRLLPDALTDPYLARWKQQHATHLDTVRASFTPIPILTAPLLADEPAGTAALVELADVVYGDADEAAVLHDTRPIELCRDDDGLQLRIALPFTTKDDVQLHRRGNDLHVKVGAIKRTVPLPAAVRHQDVARAGLHDGVLEVLFRERPVPAAQRGVR
ncbi:MAG: ArsA family ATPase [Actinobacteria bacterium]|nr:ArsA family ATPase [Actinomycetota bacterium]